MASETAVSSDVTDSSIEQDVEENVLYERKCSWTNCMSYDALKKEIRKIILAAQDLVQKSEFIKYVKHDGHKMQKIDNDLEIWMKDLERDCAIIFAGETSSGKSSVLNLIIGKNILPVRLEASTKKVCRIQYSDRLSVSTTNLKGQTTEVATFENADQMKNALKDVIDNIENDIKYVDIRYPVGMLRGNKTCVIVDTPGIGDKEQENVAQIMMEYLPNALAFVFVLNLQSAGGLQDDRIKRIFDNVTHSMDRMVCFDPNNVIFLLNKWDSLIFCDEDTEDGVYGSIVKKIGNFWKKVKDDYVLKSAAGKVHPAADKHDTYTGMFIKFQNTLEEVIGRNENKRVIFHLSCMKSFLEECKRVLTSKLQCVRQSKDEHLSMLTDLEQNLLQLEEKRKEADSNSQQNIDLFLTVATREFHDFIHEEAFKNDMLHEMHIANVPKRKTGKELDLRIQEATKTWQEENIEKILKETIFENLVEKLSNIESDLHSLKEKMMGFRSCFNITGMIASALVTSFTSMGTCIVGTLLVARLPLDESTKDVVALASFLAGLVIPNLMSDDIKTVRENTFKSKIGDLTEDNIKKGFRERYAKSVELIISSLMEEIKSEIENLNKNVMKMRGERDLYRSEENTLKSLLSIVILNIDCLVDLEKKVHNA